jgi:hypothetical protein
MDNLLYISFDDKVVVYNSELEEVYSVIIKSFLNDRKLGIEGW